MQGTVKKWIDERGFGFIAGDGGNDVFVHVSALGGLERLDVGDTVEFDEGIDPRSHKPRAENVRLIRPAP